MAGNAVIGQSGGPTAVINQSLVGVIEALTAAQKQGKVAEAITNLSRSVELQPTARGYLALGNALQQSGRSLEALTAYEQATRIAPSLTEAQQAADSIRQQLSHPQAIY